MVIGISDPQKGAAVTSLLDNAVGVYVAFDALSKAGAVWSAATFASGMGSALAVASAVQALRSKNQDPTKKLFESLGILSQKIDALAESLNDLHKEVRDFFTQTQLDFSKVFANLQTLLERQDELRSLEIQLAVEADAETIRTSVARARSAPKTEMLTAFVDLYTLATTSGGQVQWTGRLVESELRRDVLQLLIGDGDATRLTSSPIERYPILIEQASRALAHVHKKVPSVGASDDWFEQLALPYTLQPELRKQITDSIVISPLLVGRCSEEFADLYELTVYDASIRPDQQGALLTVGQMLADMEILLYWYVRSVSILGTQDLVQLALSNYLDRAQNLQQHLVSLTAKSDEISGIESHVLRRGLLQGAVSVVNRRAEVECSAVSLTQLRIEAASDFVPSFKNTIGTLPGQQEPDAAKLRFHPSWEEPSDDACNSLYDALKLLDLFDALSFKLVSHFVEQPIKAFPCFGKGDFVEHYQIFARKVQDAPATNLDPLLWEHIGDFWYRDKRRGAWPYVVAQNPPAQAQNYNVFFASCRVIPHPWGEIFFNYPHTQVALPPELLASGQIAPLPEFCPGPWDDMAWNKFIEGIKSARTDAKTTFVELRSELAQNAIEFKIMLRAPQERIASLILDNTIFAKAKEVFKRNGTIYNLPPSLLREVREAWLALLTCSICNAEKTGNRSFLRDLLINRPGFIDQQVEANLSTVEGWRSMGSLRSISMSWLGTDADIVNRRLQGPDRSRRIHVGFQYRELPEDGLFPDRFAEPPLEDGTAVDPTALHPLPTVIAADAPATLADFDLQFPVIAGQGDESLWIGYPKFCLGAEIAPRSSFIPASRRALERLSSLRGWLMQIGSTGPVSLQE